MSHSERERDVLSTGEWQVIDSELGLTTREREIVELVLADLKESAMGAELGISPHTVHTHLERVYRKVGVRGRVQLVVRVLGACL
ncbi:MAG TPA: helix-turn-helix transcriptional regulator, partial [Gemmatimonadaceae bacterium]|nr:helix-turn-helix transcriptional regulator [Gemmatimonadaceae bacterium]